MLECGAEQVSHSNIRILCYCYRILHCSRKVVKSYDVQEELTSAHHSLGRMERELWAAEDKNGSRKMVANPWQVSCRQ